MSNSRHAFDLDAALADSEPVTPEELSLFIAQACVTVDRQQSAEIASAILSKFKVTK